MVSRVTPCIEDNLNLLACLQDAPIHAPPGLHPLHARMQAITRMQFQANCKAAKEAKVKVSKEKKLAAAAHCDEKQERFIQAAGARAAKAVAKADVLHHWLKQTDISHNCTSLE